VRLNNKADSQRNVVWRIFKCSSRIFLTYH